MKKVYLALLVVIVAGFACIRMKHGDTAGKNHQCSHCMGQEASIPASLDKYYPPASPQPVFFIGMLRMGMAMDGVMTDLMMKGPKGTAESFNRFKARYSEVSQMVPEWSGLYSMEKVDALGAALESGDGDRIMAAVGALGQNCDQCHFVNKPPVKYKYYWGNVDEITVTDPISKQTMPFMQFKHAFSADLSGIYNNVEDNNIEAARRHFAMFNARYQAFKEVCINCHDTERKYYTDQSSQEKVDMLGKALNAPNPDPNAIMGSFMDVGMNVCEYCHQIHQPAAYSRRLQSMAR